MVCCCERAYFLHFGLKILDKQLPEVVQCLQLTSDCVFETLEVLSSLLAAVKLRRQLGQLTRLLRLVALQTLVVTGKTVVRQLQLLVGTKITQNALITQTGHLQIRTNEALLQLKKTKSKRD